MCYARHIENAAPGKPGSGVHRPVPIWDDTNIPRIDSRVSALEVPF